MPVKKDAPIAMFRAWKQRLQTRGTYLSGKVADHMHIWLAAWNTCLRENPSSFRLFKELSNEELMAILKERLRPNPEKS